jgi:hypothetical protein
MHWNDAAALVIGTYQDVEVTAGDHPARPVLLPAGRDRAVAHLTIVRPDLTPSGQGKEILMAIDERPGHERIDVPRRGVL